MPTFIDLFCGIGGIRLGMERAGFSCVFSCDINAECRRTYAANFHERVYGDIHLIDARDVPDHDVLCAGFPCQPFSICGKLGGFRDTRGTLFFEICRIIAAKSPEIVLLENVKHLMYHDKKRTLETILSSLGDLGYCTRWALLNAADYGVPQNRERIIIVGARREGFDFLKIQRITPKPHLASFLDTEGDFEFLEPKAYTLIENPKMQAKSGLFFVGHRNKSIRKAGVRPGTEHLSRVHKQPNRIYSSAGIHPTIPSQETSGRFWILHDGRVRKLTINECFRIMGFPDDFLRPGSIGEQYKQVGNSVCVPMAHAIAVALGDQYFAGT